MPTCMIYTHPQQDAERTEAVLAALRRTGPLPPEGALIVFGGPVGDGWRMVSLWETREAAERFVAERLTPAVAEAGHSMEPAERTLFDVYRMAVGDLRGAPQPA